MAKKSITIFTVIIMFLTLCACTDSKTENSESGTVRESVVTDISGTWCKTDDSGNEYIYVLKPNGSGYIDAYNMRFDLKWETDNGDYVFNIDATAAYENMLGMTIDEIVEAKLVDESSLHTTKSGKFTISGGYLILVHDGVTEYLRGAE